MRCRRCHVASCILVRGRDLEQCGEAPVSLFAPSGAASLSASDVASSGHRPDRSAPVFSGAGHRRERDVGTKRHRGREESWYRGSSSPPPNVNEPHVDVGMAQHGRAENFCDLLFLRDLLERSGDAALCQK